MSTCLRTHCMYVCTWMHGGAFPAPFNESPVSHRAGVLRKSAARHCAARHAAVRGVAGRWRNLIIKRKKARVNTGAPVMQVKERMIQQCLMRSAQHKIK